MGPRFRGDDDSMKNFAPANEARAPLLWGPLTRFALAVALVAAAIDQAAKLWLLFVFDLGARGIVTLTPFLDLVLIWNCLLYTSPSPRDGLLSRMPSSA